MKKLQALIDGSAPLHKIAHVATEDYFKRKGYKEIAPYQPEDAPRQLLREFYEQDNMFSLTDHTLKQLRTVYKVNDKFEVQFAASFFVVEIDSQLIAYLDVIKAKETNRGLGSQFITQHVDFLESHMERNQEVKGAHFLVGQSQVLKPHNFFAKQGFGPLPKQFEGLKLDGCDLAYRKVSKSLEEKKGGNSVAAAIVEDIPDDKSDVSTLTNKTTMTQRGKHVDKHCPLCDFKLIRGDNWARHCKSFHTEVQVQGLKCGSDCLQCKGPVESFVVNQGKKNNHQGHKIGKCLRCGKESEARRLTDGLCTVCSKGKAKTVVNGPTSNFLNAGALAQLPSKHEIGPNDSLSMIGAKRRRELMEEELCGPFEGVLYEESEENFAKQPPKRPATEENQAVLVMSHTDADAIQALKLIERSELPQLALSVALQKVCSMFSQDSVLEFLRNGEHHVILALVPTLLARMGQLSTQQQVGLLFACLVFDGQNWDNAAAGLTEMAQSDRETTLDLFKILATKVYGKDTAKWLSENWQNMELWYFNLIKYLKNNNTRDIYSTLQLALVVQAMDVAIFVEYVGEFTKMRSSSIFADYIPARKKQPKLSFSEFVELADALLQDCNALVIRKCKGDLMKLPLSGWINQIEQAAATIHISDKGSTQEAIDEFITAYGPIDIIFSKDLFVLGSSLGLLLHETPNKGNFKQLGLAHYIIGRSRKVQKQLWCVPSGDGKSRIIVFAALLGLKTDMFKKVHLVYANKHLMLRDKADFDDLWRLAECQNRVEYHVGHDFQGEEDSLILIDESDRSTFDHPEAFEAFIEDKFCVCLTATPSNCDEQGIEAETIKSLGFKQFDYIIGQLPESAASKLQFDEVSQASTPEQKVAVIGALLKQGSVLVYALPDLVESLRILYKEAVIVDECIDSSMLRQLDKAPHKLLLATDSFAMRGIDYRSKSKPMFLVIAQQFSCIREALQGVARVGRFGDPCRKIKFADCLQLVNQRTQLEYNAQLLRFIENRKAKVLVAAATAQKQSPKKPQLTQGTRMSQTRARVLLGQPPVGQTQLGGFFKPSTILPNNRQSNALLVPPRKEDL